MFGTAASRGGGRFLAPPPAVGRGVIGTDAGREVFGTAAGREVFGTAAGQLVVSDGLDVFLGPS